MSTISTTHRSANMTILTVLAIALSVILTFALDPSIAAPKPAVIPVTGSQNAYGEFLRGEKAIYANPVRLYDALSAYHLGEKTLGAIDADLSNVLSVYRAGEKALYATSNLGTALSAYHLGEKMTVSFDVREAALLQYRQGEKGIK